MIFENCFENMYGVFSGDKINAFAFFPTTILGVVGVV